MRLIVAGRDGCTANAEHWRQQRWHIYIVYAPPHAPCPWFGMLAMFRAVAAEVWWLLIHSQDFRGLACLHLRHHPIFFHWDFCTLLEWEMSWGTKVMLRAFPESTRNILNLSLQRDTEFIVLPGWISKKSKIIRSSRYNFSQPFESHSVTKKLVQFLGTILWWEVKLYLKNAFVTERQKTPFYVQSLTKIHRRSYPPPQMAITFHTQPLLLEAADLWLNDCSLSGSFHFSFRKSDSSITAPPPRCCDIILWWLLPRNCCSSACLSLLAMT